ncbi:MAG TPA: hypothetical protein VFK11_00195 [Candidatus Saccharimonadales bacterium]|nr:hypothetical protein [Candidatus Saccharimonadales bacterium]
MATALTPTGRGVPTITSSPIEALDNAGATWYVKDDPGLEQLGQLDFLDDIGLPVPERLSPDENHMAVRSSGITLNEAVASNTLPAGRTIRMAGVLLGKTHDSLERAEAEGLAPEKTAPDSSTTAHPAANFHHRFAEGKSSSTNAMYGDLPENGLGVRSSLLELIELLGEQEIPESVGGEDELSYGDFKPDNLLYAAESGLVLIDPLVHRGRRVNDFAKFCTRFAIEPTAPDSDIRTQLQESYRQAGGQEFREGDVALSGALDLANVMSSYLGRLAKGDTSFRIVGHLNSDTAYAERVEGLVRAALAEVDRGGSE